MVILGVDAHKRTHTIVAADTTGKQLATTTILTTTVGHLEGLRWASEHSDDRVWAIEDCRHLSRRLERDLLVAGARIRLAFGTDGGITVTAGCNTSGGDVEITDGRFVIGELSSTEIGCDQPRHDQDT